MSFDAPDHPVSIRELYRALWCHAADARTALVVSMAMLTVAQGMKLAVPWMAAQAINLIQTAGRAGLGQAGLWIAAIVGTMIGVWSLQGPGRVVQRNVALRVRRLLADSLYERLAAAPLAWHEERHSGELKHRVQEASSALSDFAEAQFVYLHNTVNVLGPLIALTLLSSATGAFAVTGYVVIGIAILRFDQALMRLAQKENAAERRYAARLLDFVGNIGSLLALRLQAFARNMLDERMAEVQKPLARSIVITEWKWCAVDMMTVLLTWGIIAAYACQAHAGAAATVMLGSLFMAYQYAQRAAGVVCAIANNHQSIASARARLASARVIWDAPRRVDIDDVVDKRWSHLVLNALTYRHTATDGAQRGGVQAVSLTLARGERIALVGSSGAGKSTLLRVLSGLYSAQSGSVRSDDGRVYGRGELASSASLIQQEIEVFEGSLRENVTFGATVNEAHLAQALHTSALDEVLQNLPEGLDTFLNERGANLSGGQRQRLTIARGALAARGASLLLLDEPTSALDPVSERLVHTRLHEAFAGACIVASVHRMDLLALYDRVAFMHDGRLVDTGRTDEVAARQPAFAKMLQRTAGGATERGRHRRPRSLISVQRPAEIAV